MDRLRVNVAGFSIDYADLQILVRKPAFPGEPLGVVITENAANATSNGLEIEFDEILTAAIAWQCRNSRSAVNPWRNCVV